MAHCEVDSFVAKFKHLWYAGIKASLKIEAENGEASVVLTAGLGPLPPPLQGQRVSQRGPAKRQERRKAARDGAGHEVNGGIAAAKVSDTPVAEAEQADQSKTAEKSLKVSVVGNEVAGEASNAQNNVSVQESAQKSGVNFPCEICAFTSNWSNGLSIHDKNSF